jgi:hypothetical protein
MKRYKISIPAILIFMFSGFLLKAQEKDYDTVAIMILDRMSSVIGDLSSCSYSLNITTDHIDSNTITTSYATTQVSMVGPNKMVVDVHSQKGHRGYFYDDSILTYYSFDENNYAAIDAPPTIVEAMDSIHNAYGIDFPAADFFYPTFSDDFLNYCSQVDYLGMEDVDGKECFHISGKGKDMDIQIWVANDATMLPQHFVINYKSNNDNDVKRYEAGFSDWKLNPDLPEAMFDFLPPPGAHEVYLMPKAAPANQ